MSDPHWRVELAPRALKDLRRLDRPVQQRIIDALDRLAANAQLSGDVKRLSGSSEFRLRVGILMIVQTISWLAALAVE